MIRAGKYLLPLLMYVAACISFTYTGWLTWAPVILGFAVIPLLELVISPDRSNHAADIEPLLKENRAYNYILYLFVFLQYAALMLFLFSMTGTNLPFADRAGRILSMGVLCGTFGINLGHELGHRSGFFEQWLARLSLLTSLYLHFTLEHNKGHHKYVATKKDPTTARRGEHIYAFWMRSMAGTFLSAWNISRKETSSLLKNEMVRMQLAHILFCLMIGISFGLSVLLSFLAAAFIGILLLNTVNYIEHYGMLRQQSPSGSYQRAMPEHSWNSNHVIGRIMLFELSRHSDHHYLASRKYQILRHHDDSPELPTGYPGSMLLTLIPPLWFYIIHKKMDARASANNDS